MEKIDVIGEFFYGGNEYAIRHFSETDYCDDEVMHFENKASLRTYLLNLQKNPTTWTVLNNVARNFGLEACRTTIDRCDEENLEYLCEKIYSEEWVLIIRKYHGIKSVKLEQCCIDITLWINRNITNSAITSAILIALPFFKAFFYPYPEKVASMASSVMSVATEDWKQLAEAIKGVNTATRKSVSKAAGEHSFAHHKNRKLKQLWEEISNAFA
ncbi:MAG: hypothetical protein PVH87_24240 [Desulfobacteraceae bacterium]|jgi:hypothetical protein